MEGNKKIDKKEKIKVVITLNRSDGSERARFDNFEDASVFFKLLGRLNNF